VEAYQVLLVKKKKKKKKKSKSPFLSPAL